MTVKCYAAELVIRCFVIKLIKTIFVNQRPWCPQFSNYPNKLKCKWTVFEIVFLSECVAYILRRRVSLYGSRALHVVLISRDLLSRSAPRKVPSPT